MSQSVLSNGKLPHTALRELLGSRSAGPPSVQNDQLLSESVSHRPSYGRMPLFNSVSHRPSYGRMPLFNSVSHRPSYGRMPLFNSVSQSFGLMASL
eukprot:scaffold24140_cov76-Skeletonema_marinoi.AAC.3